MASDNATFTYTEKAAIVLMALETHSPGIANKIFAEIGEERSRTILRSITRLGVVDYPVITKVLEEFHQLAIEQKMVFGGRNVSGKILKETFGIHEQEDYFSDQIGLFDFLSLVSDDALVKQLSEETLQFNAMILSYLPEDRMAKLMTGLSVDRSSQISKSVLELDIPNLRLVWRMQRFLEEKLLGRKVSEGETKEEGQLFKLSRVLEIMAPETRRSVMELLQASDEAAAGKLESLIFTFSNLPSLSDRDLQSLLYEIEPLRTLAVAMMNQDETFKIRINENLSDRVRMMLDEEIDALADGVSEDDILLAQRDIIQLARQLEKTKKINPLRVEPKGGS